MQEGKKMVQFITISIKVSLFIIYQQISQLINAQVQKKPVLMVTSMAVKIRDFSYLLVLDFDLLEQASFALGY